MLFRSDDNRPPSRAAFAAAWADPARRRALATIVRQLATLNRALNATDNTGLSICDGFSESGLPLSLQIGARPFEDTLALKVGHALEKALGTRGRYDRGGGNGRNGFRGARRCPPPRSDR